MSSASHEASTTATSFSVLRPSQHSPWDPVVSHANGHPHFPPDPALYVPNFPQGRSSLAGISIRAFTLGLTFSAGTLVSGYLAYLEFAAWRAPFFLAILSLFHFLEFFVTAKYNTPAASTAAFLLSANGSAYNVAHTLATLETLGSHTIYRYPSLMSAELQSLASSMLLWAGFGLLCLGQLTRSMAMAKAGTNFNHTVQMRKKEGHELVTDGIYSWLRHPSYFGFFWWGLGSQIVLGNWLCFVAYTVILWRFFNERIRKEEELLVKFFGDEYVTYRSRTRVGIPFIR